MNADTLGQVVRDHFCACAADFGLSASAVAATYVLNWGGFVNHSYHITDGRRSYHLKLAVGDENQRALRRWHTLAPLLAKYHAPAIVAWIDVGLAAGLLFECVPGAVPEFSRDVIDAMVPVLSELYDDGALAAAIGAAPARATSAPDGLTALDVYCSSFDERFTEDLRAIANTPPSFVSAATLAWMRDESMQLRELITATPAFHETVHGAVHGDLWLNNVHWVSASEWYLLDWDDVRIGDPAADVAALLGPTAHDLQPLKLVERALPILTLTQRERLPLLGRATLLDWVIDPVADWLEADVSDAHVDAVRAEKERVHGAALSRYRELYTRLERRP